MRVDVTTFLLIKNEYWERVEYVYINTIERVVRFPPPRRTIQSLLEVVANWRPLSQGGERAKIARVRGITCYSNLWTLYHLYDLDVCTDMVYDTMHILALCVFKKYIHLLVQTFTNLGREKDLEEALRLVSQPAYRPKMLRQWWLTSLNALGFFKSKEYANFILWCLPFISKKLQIEKHFVLRRLGCCSQKQEDYFFVNTREHG